MKQPWFNQLLTKRSYLTRPSLFYEVWTVYIPIIGDDAGDMGFLWQHKRPRGIWIESEEPKGALISAFVCISHSILSLSPVCSTLYYYFKWLNTQPPRPIHEYTQSLPTSLILAQKLTILCKHISNLHVQITQTELNQSKPQSLNLNHLGFSISVHFENQTGNSQDCTAFIHYSFIQSRQF